MGTAVLGALFAVSLGRGLAGTPVAGVTATTPEALAALAEPLRQTYLEAFMGAVDTVFLTASGIALLSFLGAWFLRESRLRETVAAHAGDLGHEAGDSFPHPVPDDPREQLIQGLAALVSRDVKRQWIASIVQRAGLDLSPAAAWLLIQVDRHPSRGVAALAAEHDVPEGILMQACEELASRGLVRENRPTREGCAVLRRLIEARRERLAELFPETEGVELAAAVRRIAQELVPDPRIQPA